MISGIAPQAGIYVLTVCVEEIRNGTVIATQRKDVQLNVANCGITAAILEKAYRLCDTSMTLHASNLSSSSLVNSYKWKVLDRNFAPIAAYTTPNVQHNFSDTGLYYLRLIINENEICHDSSTAPVLVYPGFHADFSYKGLCVGKPTAFNDISTSKYGVVNYWNWDFGDTSATPNPNASKNPTVTYSVSGSKNVVLIVRNSVGCIDTVSNTLQVSDKPPLLFAFTDTLICKGDTLRLASAAPGAVQWSPMSNVIIASGPTAWVAPANTSTFYGDLNDNGCTNRDSVKVRVVSSVSLQTMPDTIICQGDQVNLHVQSNGLKFNWSPSVALNNASLQNPSAQLTASTLFTVKASIGSCQAAGTFSVKTIPYPTAFAGNDTTICFGTAAQLNAISDGKIFQWLPTPLVANSNTKNTTAHPSNTTSYIFLAFDNKGCPKPGRDTVIVKVLPDINATVGHDTNLVVGQPLQLEAAGGVRYQWNPASNLSSAVIANPVALFDETTDGIRYKVLAYNEAGCADSASILIKVFSKGTPVYVPTGFTPNNDGLNDVLRPTLVGVAHLDYFSVYNRYGEVVFTTNTLGKGWDGVFHGYPQPAGTYVWTIKVLNYDNTPIISKGTSVLIR